jgi:hypothetical protein
VKPDQEVKVDERTLAVGYVANSWAATFLGFALLMDATCRAVFFHEAVWDLLAIVVIGGGISSIYMVRHNVFIPMFGGKRRVFILWLVVTAVVSFTAAFILAMINAR